MEVNRELPHLELGLDESVHLLKPEGRVLVLAYHSLEDRRVKEVFAEESKTTDPMPHGLPVEPVRRTPLLRVITRRARRPAADELATNPRAKSARLRGAERIAS